MKYNISKENELKNCSFVKCILMFFVVLGHSIAFNTGGWFTENPVFKSNALATLYKWFMTFHTYGFVLVSGYIFWFLKSSGRYKAFKPFIVNKIKRLIVPYFFIAIVLVIPVDCFFFDNTVFDIAKNYLLAVGPCQLWFLWMLFIVFVISWLLFSVFERSFLLGGAISIVLYVVGIVGSVVLPNYFQIWTGMQYITFFWIGCMIRKGKFDVLKKFPVFVWIIINIGLLILTSIIPSSGMLWKALSICITFLNHIVGSLMAFFILQIVAEKINWQDSKAFKILSKHSMPVYLIHQQIIYFLIYWLNGLVNPYLHALINFVVSLGLSIVISGLLMKFKVSRFLIGEK